MSRVANDSKKDVQKFYTSFSLYKKTAQANACTVFWYAGRDTLRPFPFDRPGRCPKGFMVLETSQFQNAVAHFELLRRTPPSGVLIPFFASNTIKRHKQTLVPFFGTPEGIRTPDLLVRSQTLYPTELPAHIKMVTRTGIEPVLPP